MAEKQYDIGFGCLGNGTTVWNRLVCGDCGTKYRRTMWVRRDKQKEYVWRCMNRLEHGKKKCKHSPGIKEEFLISAVTDAANSMITDATYAKELIKGSIAEVMDDNVQNKLNENVLNKQLQH